MRLKIARQDRRRVLNRRIDERRLLPDRRVPPNRRGLRRRRTTPSPFTVEQLAYLRGIFAKPGKRVNCPACSGAFTLWRGRRRGEDVLRRIQCNRCGKSAVVTGRWRMRVLVIAAQEVVRNALRDALEDVGHQVADAANSEVGLWAYQQNPADVVFVDVLATGRTPGSEFIRQILKYSPDAKVIAVSGRTSYSGPDPLRLARELGAFRTIRAPFSQEQLLEVIESVQAK